MKINPIELKYWRERRVMTKKEVADTASVARSTYYALESGNQLRARPATIRKIAATLKVSPEKLVDVERPPSIRQLYADRRTSDLRADFG